MVLCGVVQGGSSVLRLCLFVIQCPLSDGRVLGVLSPATKCFRIKGTIVDKTCNTQNNLWYKNSIINLFTNLRVSSIKIELH